MKLFFLIGFGLLNVGPAYAEGNGDPPLFRALTGIADQVLAERYPEADTRVQALLPICRKDARNRIQAAVPLLEKMHETVTDSRLVSRRRYDLTLDLWAAVVMLVVRESASDRGGRGASGAALRFLRAAEQIAQASHEKAVTEMVAAARALLIGCPTEPGLDSAVVSLDTALGLLGEGAGGATLKTEGVLTAMREAATHVRGSHHYRNGSAAAAPAPPGQPSGEAVPLGRYQCTASDKHHETHSGGHPVEALGEGKAREDALQECRHYHDQCRVRDCARNG